MEQKLVLIINTLNQIELRGYSNMNKMLGCIQALEEILKGIKEEGKEDNGRQSNK